MDFSWLLSRVQSTKHVLLWNGRTVNTRDEPALEDLGGPFDAIARTVDVRPIADAAATGTGTHNLGNIGLFVWRLQPYATHYHHAVAVGSTPRHFQINPLGVDVPLFNLPRGARGGGMEDRARLPIPLTRGLFAADLAQTDRRPDASALVNSTFYGPARGLAVVVDGRPIRPVEIASVSLDWDDPDFILHWSRGDLVGKHLAIDVERGRMAFRTTPHRTVDVHFTYGFSGNLGGGPYDRRPTMQAGAPAGARRYVVGRDHPYRTIQDALATWAADVGTGATRGFIRITDNGLYELSGASESVEVLMPAGGELTIQADNGRSPFSRGNLAVRDVSVVGGGGGTPSLTIDGLLLDGRIEVAQAVRLTLRDTTLVPRARRHSVEWTHPRPDSAAAIGLQVTLERCIVGMLRLPSGADGLRISESIVDAVPPRDGERHPAISASPRGHGPAYGPPTTLDNVTIFGPVAVVEFGDSHDVIFSETLLTQRTQPGSLSFCYVPLGSTTPRRFRCQPDLAIGDETDPARQAEIELNVQPVFTSMTYGQTGYAQLAVACPDAIARGAEDGSEMGVFGSLGTGRRRESLTRVLDEYLGVGFQPGVFYVT